MTHDFLIIGGGIAGVSVAARLAPFGRVLLLEGEPALGYHASGRSAALFAPRYGKASVVALSLASAAEYHGAVDPVLIARGLMVVGRAGDRAAFEADAHALGLSPLPVAEARGLMPILNPDTTAFAAYDTEAWDLDTDRVLQGYAREARRHGAEIVTDAGVTALRRDAGHWHAETTAGQFSAPFVVNAAGAWADALAALAGVRPLGLQPLRRSMARLPAPGGHDLRHWPMVIGAGERWYCKPDAGKLLVSPAEEDPATPHDAWADDMVLAEGLARYEEMVTEPVTRVVGSWAGLRTFAPDRTLVIGFDRDAPGFFWLAGQGGYGFQTAPAASTLAADLIAGRVPGMDARTVAALAPSRFG